MSRRELTTTTLAIRLVRHRLRNAIVLAAAGFVLAAATCGLAAVRSSALSAIEQSVRADRAGLEYAIQAGTAEALDALSAVDELVSVKDTSASVSTGTRQLPVLLRTSAESQIALGTLVDGERAEPGEATVSRHVADALGVSVGDNVQVRAEGDGASSVLVAGITVNTADVEDATVVVVDPALVPSEVTVWLSADDPYLDTSLVPMLDSRTITYQSSAPVVAAAQAALPPELAALRLLPVALAAFLLLLTAAMAVAMSSTSAKDVRALTASGMASRSAWGIVLRVALGALLAGMSLGFVVSWAGLASARRPLSHAVGQDWTHVAAPAVPFLILCLVVIALTALLLAASQRLRAIWYRLVARRGFRSSAWAPGLSLAAGGALLVAAFVSHNKTPPGNLSAIAPYAAALVALSVPWLAAHVVRQRLPRATTRVVWRLVASGMAAFVVAALVATLSSATSARRAHDANAFDSRTDAPQPAGSLLVTEIPDDAGDLLIGRFEELGGNEAARYRLPDESKFRVRSTGPALVKCMSEVGTLNPDEVSADCFPQRTLSPVNTVALTDTGEAAADPGLVEDGRTGLLIYQDMTPTASSLAETDASADESLGGNMPGLVLPAGGETARRLGLVPSGRSLVALLDFHSLSQTQQAEMRGLINRVAPAAQVADSASRSHYDTERSVAAGVGVLGAALSMLVMLAGGAAVLVGERQTLLTLVDIGGITRLRFRVVARWAAVGAFTALVLLPLSRFAAEVAGVNSAGAVGYWWLAPPIAMALSCAGLLGLAMGGVRAVRE